MDAKWQLKSWIPVSSQTKNFFLRFGSTTVISFYKIIKSTSYYISLQCFKLLILNITQVSIVSRLKHENVVELVNYCVDGPLRALSYEYAPNGSLHDILHG